MDGVQGKPVLPVERSIRVRDRFRNALKQARVSHDPEYDLWSVTDHGVEYHVKAGYLVSAKVADSIETWGGGVPLDKQVLADMARKAIRVPLREDDVYEVIKDGASLTRLEPTNPYAFVPKQIPLNKGDVITYLGTRQGFGDSPSIDTFESPDGEVGEFNPNSWGSADQSYLKNLDFEGMLRHLMNISDPAGANEAEAEAYANRIAEMYNMDVMDVYDLAAGQFNALGEPKTTAKRTAAMRWVEETGVWAATPPDDEYTLTVEEASEEYPDLIDEIEKISPVSYEGESYVWTILRGSELVAGGFSDAVEQAQAAAETVYDDIAYNGTTALESIEEDLHAALAEGYGWDIAPAEQAGFLVRDDSRTRHLIVENGADRFMFTIQEIN